MTKRPVRKHPRKTAKAVERKAIATELPVGGVTAPASLIAPAQRRRLERRNVLERITSNGTISALVMIVAAVVAVICANTPAYEAIHAFLQESVSLVFGPWSFSLSIELFVNDFLMAIFFLLVGIELKYEMTVGELRQPRQAMLPMLAAVGGVVVPACIYGFVNRGGAVYGWAIPMATDIAFALGVLSLLGNRVPPALKVFFSTLAIADDLLAIAAIALFYGHAPNLFWLGCAAAVTAALVVLNRWRRFRLAPYLALGLVLWFCLFQSGVHATLAGVILAFTIPARSDIVASELVGWLGSKLPELDDRFDDEVHILGQHDFTRALAASSASCTGSRRRCSASSITFPRRSNFLILPIFAFVNAQVRLVGVDPLSLVFDPVAIGVYLGMLLGKPIGIAGMTALLVKTRIAHLPTGVSMRHIVGVGILGGIGFTMSILIAGLAFTQIPAELLAAKTAILAGSASAALVGLLYMHVACGARGEKS